MGDLTDDDCPCLCDERDELRARLAKIREWATADYGGRMRPIDVWPGLAALLADDAGESL